mmetsp:Transcript_12027/g.48409  ORF Transcript_12027/g.48409 Transcript_12027/m.48409 type:complete len:386 (+) Transcript_12027:462-1619(+)
MRLGREGDAKDNARALLAVAPWALDLDAGALELFEGRCGYLQAVLFARAAGLGAAYPGYPGKKKTDKAQPDTKLFADEEFDAVLGEVQTYLDAHEKDDASVRWHGKCYLGAAHGLAGIATVLASTGDTRRARRLHDCARRFELPSGNLPSSTGRPDRDLLVHWCHGAPGWVEPRLQLGLGDHACRAGDVTWRRGVLAAKGPGLCHGIPGNACALLSLYRATGEATWLRRAGHFAAHLVAHLDELRAYADTPTSLFEGTAGALYFVLDLLDARDGREQRLPPAPFFFLGGSQDAEIADHDDDDDDEGAQRNEAPPPPPRGAADRSAAAPETSPPVPPPREGALGAAVSVSETPRVVVGKLVPVAGPLRARVSDTAPGGKAVTGSCT